MSSFDIVARSGFCFYVVDDLNKAVAPRHEFQSLSQALAKFQSFASDAAALPALGIDSGSGCLDLIYQVNGDNILVPDYRNENLSDSMLKLRPVFEKIVAFLVDEAVIRNTYCHDFFDRVGRSCPVIVPIGQKNDSYDNSYCADKRLKTVSGFGFDSINHLFINGHGWVDYREVRENTDAYCTNGVLYVENVNVNYVLKSNWTGIDGQMDISVHDFIRMLQDVNKEFSLLVYDSRFDNSYVVASYDNLKDAVRAWYEVPADLTAQVNQTVGYSYQQIVFNGVDDNFDEISYEKAAEIYGFNAAGIECLIADANGRAISPAEKSATDFEKER